MTRMIGSNDALAALDTANAIKVYLNLNGPKGTQNNLNGE